MSKFASETVENFVGKINIGDHPFLAFTTKFLSPFNIESCHLSDVLSTIAANLEETKITTFGKEFNFINFVVWTNQKEKSDNFSL